MSSFYKQPIRPDELYHHGILGMKWGIRRYQPYPKGYNGSGKEVGKASKVQQRTTKSFNLSKEEFRKLRSERIKSGNVLRSGSKVISQQEMKRVSLDRARKAAEEKRSYEQEKERVLKTGNATEVLKFKGDLTNEQMQQAINRINLEQQLSSMSSREVQSAMKKMDKAMANLKTVNNWASTVTDTYNMLANTFNAMEEDKSKHWKTINKGSGGKGK